MATELSREGSITCWLSHSSPGWLADGLTHLFPDVEHHGIRASFRKEHNGPIRVVLYGALGQVVHLEGRAPHLTSVPNSDERGIFVAVTWKFPVVTLYLNARIVQSLQVQAH